MKALKKTISETGASKSLIHAVLISGFLSPCCWCLFLWFVCGLFVFTDYQFSWFNHKRSINLPEFDEIQGPKIVQKIPSDASLGSTTEDSLAEHCIPDQAHLHKSDTCFLILKHNEVTLTKDTQTPNNQQQVFALAKTIFQKNLECFICIRPFTRCPDTPVWNRVFLINRER